MSLHTGLPWVRSYYWPRGSDGCQGNAPKGSGWITLVIPTSFGQPPIVPWALNMGSPGMAVEVVSAKPRLPETGLERFMLKRSGVNFRLAAKSKRKFWSEYLLTERRFAWD